MMVFSHLCLKMLSFLHICACTMPHTFSDVVKFYFHLRHLIAFLVWVVLWLSRGIVINHFFRKYIINPSTSCDLNFFRGGGAKKKFLGAGKIMEGGGPKKIWGGVVHKKIYLWFDLLGRYLQYNTGVCLILHFQCILYIFKIEA